MMIAENVKAVATLKRILTVSLLVAILFTCNAFPVVAQSPPNLDAVNETEAVVPTDEEIRTDIENTQIDGD